MRLTFKDPEVCGEEVVRRGLHFDGLPICPAPADDRLRNVYLRDLPVEINNEVVSSFFSDYGFFKSCAWITAALTISPLCVMVIVL